MRYALAAVMLLILPVAVFSQESSELPTPPNGDNERAEVSQWIGPTRVSIEYHSPHVHNPAAIDRTGHIWGELVHYGFFDEGFGPTKGAPWRAGANESTSIAFSHDVKVQGKDLKAGTYALFRASLAQLCFYLHHQHGLSPRLRAHHFFATTAFNARMSTACSATMCFGCRFSSCSCRKRFASRLL